MQYVSSVTNPARLPALQKQGRYANVAGTYSAKRCSLQLRAQRSFDAHQLERQKSLQNLTHTALQDSLLVLLLTSPAASYAADPAADTTKAIQETAASTPGGPSAFGLIVLFSPLLLYGIFNVYRERINPQAKLSNFAVIIGALLLAANLFSIVVYRVRFF